ncbi:MAG: GC-type dockerin domain-anchored protein [Planctomycetota bacterium]|nr:GC-type dockerin domain-anchored protein [Planctomycetota bacterium]
MMMRSAVAVLATLGCVSGALGQGNMEFSLSASQTEVHANDPTITIEVYASWDDDPVNVGFAAALFDLLGVENWETGAVTSFVGNPMIYDNWSDDEGVLQPNNDILGSMPAQLPPLFNGNFDSDNPIHVMTIEWETDDFSPRQVCVGTFPLEGYIYLDQFGTTMSMSVVGETLCFDVIDNWCPGDFNNDGNKDTQDVLAFLNAWAAGDHRADWNQDGTIDTRDVLNFLNDWLTAC